MWLYGGRSAASAEALPIVLAFGSTLINSNTALAPPPSSRRHMLLAMKRELSDDDSQHYIASCVKRHQISRADACAPRAPFTSSHTTDVESWVSKLPGQKRAMSTYTVSQWVEQGILALYADSEDG